jgi:hypothetical protein
MATATTLSAATSGNGSTVDFGPNVAVIVAGN